MELVRVRSQMVKCTGTPCTGCNVFLCDRNGAGHQSIYLEEDALHELMRVVHYAPIEQRNRYIVNSDRTTKRCDHIYRHRTSKPVLERHVPAFIRATPSKDISK